MVFATGEINGLEEETQPVSLITGLCGNCQYLLWVRNLFHGREGNSPSYSISTSCHFSVAGPYSF